MSVCCLDFLCCKCTTTLSSFIHIFSMIANYEDKVLLPIIAELCTHTISSYYWYTNSQSTLELLMPCITQCKWPAVRIKQMTKLQNKSSKQLGCTAHCWPLTEVSTVRPINENRCAILKASFSTHNATEHTQWGIITVPHSFKQHIFLVNIWFIYMKISGFNHGGKWLRGGIWLGGSWRGHMTGG